MRWVRTALPSLRLRAPFLRRVNTECGCCWSARRMWSRRNSIATPAAARLPIEIVHASEFITMEDKVEAIRAKRDSSMRVGLRMVREGQAAGFVTAGNTGAAMATAKVVLGAVPGVDRPALAAVFPTAPGKSRDAARRRRQRRLHRAESRTVCGDGRHLFPRHVRKAARNAGTTRRTALHRRRRKQRQRPHPRIVSAC